MKPVYQEKLMKATLTYRCDEPGHEQVMTITATGDFDAVTTSINLEVEFDPPCSDDTSDPSGLLNAAICALNNFNDMIKQLSAEE